MSDNYNNISKDAGNAKADEYIKKASIENAALTITNDINKWYSDKNVQKLESRLETNIEQENTDGITTTVNSTDGVQTNVENKEQIETEVSNPENSINTKVNQAEDTEKTEIAINNNGDNINESELTETNFGENANNTNNQNHSKIKTKINSNNTTNGKNNKIQTKISRNKKISKVASGAIKTKQSINRVTKSIARKGKKIQTASEGNIGESFSSNFKDSSARGIGKVLDVSTRKVRQKIRTKLAKVMVQMAKAVFKVLVNLLKSLISLLIKAAPVIIAVVVVVFLIVSIFSSGSSVFGENAKDSKLNKYVQYMEDIEGDLSSSVDWKAVCAVIYGLDIDIQYDKAEQYLLEQFKQANLYVESSNVSDYINWLNNNYSVVTSFYQQKGISDNDSSLSESTISLINQYYNSAEFMKLIDEKRNSSVNTGSVEGSTGTGLVEDKFKYPTSSTTITAGFPNYSSGKYHGGIDFGVETGTDVCAVADGTVIVAKELDYSYGYYIIIDHGDGVSTLYAHNSKLLVGVGDEVSQGDVIAESGSTGNSTGPHCHFEVRINGTRVNPLDYLE